MISIVRLILLYLNWIEYVYALDSQLGLLGAALSFQDAFVDILQNDTPRLELAAPAPRLVMYVQTFTDTAGRPLSLLSLLEHETKITHVIIGSIHLHERPGVIMLNNEPLGSDIYDDLWKEVRILQDNDVKVLALLGGAAPGTYARLSGNDTEVRLCPSQLLNHREALLISISSTPTTNHFSISSKTTVLMGLM